MGNPVTHFEIAGAGNKAGDLGADPEEGAVGTGKHRLLSEVGHLGPLYPRPVLAIMDEASDLREH